MSTSTNLFKQNENEANRYTAFALAGSALLMLAALALVHLGIYESNVQAATIVLVTGAVLATGGGLLVLVFKQYGAWVKYVNIVIMSVNISLIQFVEVSQVNIIAMFILFAACLFFNMRLAIFASALTLVLINGAIVAGVEWFPMTEANASADLMYTLAARNIQLVGMVLIGIFLSLRAKKLLSQMEESAREKEASFLSLNQAFEKNGQAAVRLVDTLDALTRVSRESLQLNEHITASTNQIAATFTETMGSAEETREYAVVIHNIFEETVKFDEFTRNTSRSITDMIHNCRDSLHQVSTAIHQLGATFESSGSVIKELYDHTETIGDMLKRINDIASNTSLLSLNAKIEAARSEGGSGGFSVIAGEVSKLAGQSMENAHYIGDIMSRIGESSGEAKENMQGTAAAIAKAVQALENTMSAFQHILTETAQINETLDARIVKAEDLLKAIQQIRHISVVLTDTVKSNHEEIGAINQNSENQLEVMKGIDSEIHKIEQLAVALNQESGQKA
ncbi:methyl-accepting chemotaxis protein [Paenibacillus sp. CAU 1782]